MEGSMFFVFVRDEQGAGVLHAQSFQGIAGGLFHLNFGGQFVRMPRQREMKSILFAALGAASLISCREFHDASAEVSVFTSVNFKPKPLAGYPCDAVPFFESQVIVAFLSLA